MNLPVFMLIRCAKARRVAPQEIRHSGILTLEYLREHDKPLFLFKWDAPNGAAVMREIACRAIRGKVVRSVDYADLLDRIAKRIYQSGSMLGRLRGINASSYRLPCGSVKNRLVDGDGLDYSQPPKFPIPVVKAKTMRCRWCDTPVFYKEHWIGYDKTVRCNAPDCRRMDYLQNKPQSKGGINLTPRQRQEIGYEAWQTQRAINYLLLIQKELKRNGRKPSSHVR